MSEYRIFNSFNLDSKVKYFISYYFYEAQLYNNTSSDFSIFNLHSLIRIIIEELSRNGINRNLKIFQNKLKQIKQKDYLAKEQYQCNVDAIINNMTSYKEYALIIANNLLLELENGKYAQKIITRLEKLLFSKKDLEKVKEEIQYLTDSIIIELSIYGYSSKKIEKIIEEIFSKYTKDDKFVFTQYPAAKDLVGKDKIISFIDKLTIRDRIKVLSLYFKKKKEKRYYLFNILGFEGENLDIKINNVNIYNWKTHHKFKIEIDKKLENEISSYMYGKFVDNDIHCSVLVEAIDGEDNFELVNKELDIVLDVLHLYNEMKCNIKVDYTYYIVFDKNKNVCSEGMTQRYNEDFHRKIGALKYDKEAMNNLNRIYSNYYKYIISNSKQDMQLIINSVRYYRKAKESFRTEDKILNYWICLENLLNIDTELPTEILDKDENDKKLNKIISMVPNLIIKNRIINKYWILYEHFYNRYSSYLEFNPKTNENDSKLIALNKIETNRLQFLESGKINLIKFINNITIIDGKCKIEIDQEIYEEYNKILNDKNRNMIVHNAQYDITFMDFYIKQMDLIVMQMLNIVIDSIYKDNGNNELNYILINKYIESKQTIKELKNMTLKEWFNMEQ